jgi:dolichol kinase
MSTSAPSPWTDLAGELHALLRETDPVRWTDAMAASARARWARIRAAIEERVVPLEQSGRSARTALEEALVDVGQLVREHSPPAEAAGEQGESSRSQWMELRARLMPAYERLAAELRARSLRVPTLRPTNYNRIAFHVSSALGALVLLEVVLTRAGTLWATGLFAGTFWFLEITRALSRHWNDRLMRVRFFQLIIHPHEQHHVNSATWYASALVLLAIFSPVYASAAALAVLGVGDPLAGLVGRRWGRVHVGAGRTLEGSLAFLVGGTAAAFGALWLWHAAAWPVLLAISVAAAVGGAVAETLCRRVDDNFGVPVAAVAAAALTAALLGAPL